MGDEATKGATMELEPAQGDTTVPAHRLGVVVVDSQHVVRAGVSLLISGESDMEVLGEAGSADEALELIRRLKRRTGVLVLVGLGLSGARDGLWLVRTIRETHPYFKVVGCGVNGDKSIVSRTLFAGADGYVDKCGHPEEFLAALRHCVRGEMVLEGLPPEALGPIADALAEHQEPERPVTERERSVLALAAQGLTARQIGTQLGVRERTVTTHLDHIYRKLGVSGRLAAVNAAMRLGLLSMDHPALPGTVI
jgi:DNA-binding NarL/FixJ family response regulator